MSNMLDKNKFRELLLDFYREDITEEESRLVQAQIVEIAKAYLEDYMKNNKETIFSDIKRIMDGHKFNELFCIDYLDKVEEINAYSYEIYDVVFNDFDNGSFIADIEDEYFYDIDDFVERFLIDNFC